MAEGPEKKAVKKAGAKNASSGKKATPAKRSTASVRKAATKKATSSKRAATADPSHDDIEQRAYEIHEREGGNHEENWLRAERELRGS